MSLRFLKAGKKCCVLLFVASATSLITSEGFPKDGLFIDELVGSWSGTGKLLGTDSDFSMQWEWVFDGKFARLTFQNKFLKAEAFYKATGSDQYEGTWFDSRGKVLPLKAKVENATLVTHWGSDETERGRTVYRPIGGDKIEVEDFVFKDNAWQPFGRADYSRAPDPLAIVRDLQRAFNAHDVEAMAANTHTNATWISIVKDSAVVETDGETALRESMTGYFKTIPSARSQIEDAMVSGSYVAIRERAFWQGKDSEQSQFALGVYQIRDGKIARVWYFPAER